MFHGDDDEVQKVDSTYLGPPGKYIGRISYRAAGLFILLAPTLLFIVDKIVGLGFWTVLWSLIGAMMLSGWMSDNVTTNRPLTGSIRMASGELFTPRRKAESTKLVRGPERIKVRQLDLRTSVQRPDRVREL